MSNLPEREDIMSRDYEIHVGETDKKKVEVYRRLKPLLGAVRPQMPGSNRGL